MKENELVRSTLGIDETWPAAMKAAFEKLIDAAYEQGPHGPHVLCVICVDMDTRVLSTALSPGASQNPHKAEMFKSLRDMFEKMSARHSQ